MRLFIALVFACALSAAAHAATAPKGCALVLKFRAHIEGLSRQQVRDLAAQHGFTITNKQAGQAKACLRK